MTHDLLCPPGWWLEGDGPCEFCALIARVREDERAAALRDALAAIADRIADLYSCRRDDDCWRSAHGAGLAYSDVDALAEGLLHNSFPIRKESPYNQGTQ